MYEFKYTLGAIRSCLHAWLYRSVCVCIPCMARVRPKLHSSLKYDTLLGGILFREIRTYVPKIDLPYTLIDVSRVKM